MNKDLNIKTPVIEITDYSPKVPFYRFNTICEHTLVTDDELSPIIGPGWDPEFYAKPGYCATYRLISDGTHAPTFSADFKKAVGSGEWLSTGGAINIIKFEYNGTDFTYSLGTVVAQDLVANTTIDINTQIVSYTLQLSDAGKLVTIDNAAPNILTVPGNLAVQFPLGTVIVIASIGAGQTTIAPAGAATIVSPEAATILQFRYSVATLTKIGTDIWLLSGDVVSA